MQQVGGRVDRFWNSVRALWIPEKAGNAEKKKKYFLLITLITDRRLETGATGQDSRKKKVETEGKAGCFPLFCSSSFFFGLSNPDACHVCFREICISGIAVVRSIIDKVPTINAGENYSSRMASRTYVRSLDADAAKKKSFYFFALVWRACALTHD